MLIDEIEALLGGYFPFEATTDLRFVLTFSFLTAAAATRFVMPHLIRKLDGEGITGTDINKPDPKPEIPEMGGLGWLLGLYSGVFGALIFFTNGPHTTHLYLATLMTITGAAMAGILDDLIGLRQRFKAGLSFIFAAPLVVFVGDYTIWFPVVGFLDFGIVYPLLLVPLGVASAAQSMNMLEGFNGLSAGNCLIIALGMVAVSFLTGKHDALPLLVPFFGATAVFLAYNRYPAEVFPGDVFTLAAGAYLACCAMIGKFELAGAVMFTPQIVEFFYKQYRGLPSSEWWGVPNDGKLHCPWDRPRGLAQWFIKRFEDGVEEGRLVATMWAAQAVFALGGLAISSSSVL
jgi:UDP-N-acetylglucosamine--dolichyl-phosphate N-acetylglucosaminephosphotransferase